VKARGDRPKERTVNNWNLKVREVNRRRKLKERRNRNQQERTKKEV